jgi:nucleoid-associated protein YgaU
MPILKAPFFALAALAFASAANAQPLADLGGQIAPAQATAPRLAASEVADADLAALSGGQELVAMTDQTLSAVNSGNTINAGSVTNGPVSLNANAFSGFAGIGNFVINTGNNNNLQGSLSVNIVLAPGS